jgi:hypothetical protein
LRKVTRNRSALASGGAIYKIMCLALRNAAKKWTMPVKDWAQPSTSLRRFSASGFQPCEFYLHKTIDRSAGCGKAYTSSDHIPCGPV